MYLISELFRSVRETCSCSIVRYTNRIAKWQAYTLVNLILKKISKIGATRCQILRLKCTQIDFGWVFAPDPSRGAYSAPRDPLAVFKGPILLRGRRGRGREEGKGRSREERGGEERPYTRPVANSWLRHWYKIELNSPVHLPRS